MTDAVIARPGSCPRPAGPAGVDLASELVPQIRQPASGIVISPATDVVATEMRLMRC